MSRNSEHREREIRINRPLKTDVSISWMKIILEYFIVTKAEHLTPQTYVREKFAGTGDVRSKCLIRGVQGPWLDDKVAPEQRDSNNSLDSRKGMG